VIVRVCPTCAREFDARVFTCPHDGSATQELEPTRVRHSSEVLPITLPPTDAPRPRRTADATPVTTPAVEARRPAGEGRKRTAEGLAVVPPPPEEVTRVHRDPPPAAAAPGSTEVTRVHREAVPLEALPPTRHGPKVELPWSEEPEDRTLSPMGADRTVVVDPLIGQKVGEYVIKGALGQGSMGLVYEAHHPLIGKRVAIKCLKRDVAANPEEAARLLAEARAANSIGHRGIVDIFGFGTLADGRQYFAMEFLVGEGLDARIARGPMEVGEALSLLEEILPPLAAAHAANVVHRDLKPSNIFIVRQPDGSTFVKLLDFGLAKSSPFATPMGLMPQTNVARMLGTPAYMAPEQARGESVSARTDLYALGVIAFELFTGRPPFPAPNPFEVINQHLTRAPPRVSETRAGAPPALDEFVFKLMEKEPAARPASAEEVREELAALRAKLNDRTSASLPPVPERTVVGVLPPPPALGKTRRTLSEVATDPAKPAAPLEPSDQPQPRELVGATSPSAPAQARPGPNRLTLALAFGLVAVLVGASLGAWLAFRTPTPGPETPKPLAPRPAPPKPAPVKPEPPGEKPAPAAPTEPPEEPDEADARPTAPRPAPPHGTRLSRVKREWLKVRSARPPDEQKRFDEQLKALEAMPGATRAERTAQKKGLDDFVHRALKGKEP